MVAEILEKQQQQHPQPKMTRNCPAWSAKVPLPCLGTWGTSSFFEVERDRRVTERKKRPITPAKWRGRWRCGTMSSYTIVNENWMILS
ncbi:hypothetical protein EYF80_054730 [Liparis tanakae]|uniref:Uncharacterized protein n=1 Tax=Liparis tanakae TaxID=230148 RepID=A0A4Z2F2X8_9TELE|nr:hypothetical protein EYF80_054730 [Liparis tanakae]